MQQHQQQAAFKFIRELQKRFGETCTLSYIEAAERNNRYEDMEKLFAAYEESMDSDVRYLVMDALRRDAEADYFGARPERTIHRAVYSAGFQAAFNRMWPNMRSSLPPSIESKLDSANDVASTHSKIDVAQWLRGMHDYARDVDQPYLLKAAEMLESKPPTRIDRREAKTVLVHASTLSAVHVCDGEEVITGDEDGQAWIATFASSITAANFLELMITQNRDVYGERRATQDLDQRSEPLTWSTFWQQVRELNWNPSPTDLANMLATHEASEKWQSRWHDARFKIWNAINKYAEACGGDTSADSISDRRMHAVTAVENAIREMLT